MDTIFSTDAIEESGGFWARQVNRAQTPSQLIFDTVFGIFMPITCFYLDPGIIRGGLSNPPGNWSMFIYGFSGLAILTLSLWFAVGHRLRRAVSLIAGVLLAGSVVSISIGIFMLPLTLIGILFIIGILGLVPFLTGFVYLRNALRVMKQSERPPRMATILLSAAIAVAAPAAAQWELNETVRQSMTRMLSADSDSAARAAQTIKRFRWAVDTDRMVRAYEAESDPVRKERIANAYKQVTGEDVEGRLMRLND